MNSTPESQGTVSVPSPTGSTRLFAIIGDPIAQVQAPVMMNRLFVARRVDALMVPVHVTAANLRQVLNGLMGMENLGGIVVTVPHKLAVCQFAQQHSRAVQLAGSTNALRREVDGSWTAENFDGLGFVQGLYSRGHSLEGKHVAVIGTGGAGVAILAALALENVASLVLHDTSTSRALEVASRLNTYRPGLASLAGDLSLKGIDLAINATPLGMRAEDPLPFEVGALPTHAVVADIIMKPAETSLLKAAAARGLHTHEGVHMLYPQIDLYAKFFGVSG
ncbi:hypothetical protein A3K87_20965 [Variovorax paradoxus]|uniref:Shikimate dehydrogenase substrate binding N-terminal domain-containing protein n=1 Tax=Variovorax paradoxus TaxID=34073 RepID=A0AA91DLD1_VARPD|nr:shikimate dehydrogenase [Variovorax paradoxus]OAK61404.1 hypothetical protein A3K87_20965 [Variovorax paradoxus]